MSRRKVAAPTSAPYQNDAGSRGTSVCDNSAAVANDLVQAALRASYALGKDVADVPIIAIAEEAGMSRSTLIRRLGGSRTALDEAVHAAGHDPGGLPPVRVRALDAAAELISTVGLASATLEAVAERAQCSLPSLYVTFGGRNELLRAVFDRHSPLLDIEDFFADPPTDLSSTVQQFYRIFINAFSREPRVAPALFAEALSRRNSPAIDNLMQKTAPRILSTIGSWLAGQVETGTIRDLPLMLLIQQLLAPVAMHVLLRPAMPNLPGIPLPDIDTVCETFTDTFLSATTPPTQRNQT